MVKQKKNLTPHLSVNQCAVRYTNSSNLIYAKIKEKHTYPRSEKFNSSQISILKNTSIKTPDEHALQRNKDHFF